LGESIPSDGGFLVQQDFSSELLKQVWETGKLASLCRKITVSGNANSIKINGFDETSRVAGSRQGGVRGYWLDEAGEKTASKPTFRKIELNLNKLIGLCYATDELLDDASALEGILRTAFVNEFGFMIDDAVINGLGVGQPLGILNSGALVTQNKETGQAASTIVAENVIKMWSRLFASSRPNAVWLINQNLEPQLHTMSIAVGTGGIPVYMPAGGLSGLGYSTLFGRPVYAIEQCQSIGTLGDIYLADFKNGYIMAEKGGMAADMSIHVRFVYDESCFRYVLRLDGQPILASEITPYKGGSSYTQSHFITLQARS
jgi:HK97 family phage major capsid protein